MMIIYRVLAASLFLAFVATAGCVRLSESTQHAMAQMSAERDAAVYYGRRLHSMGLPRNALHSLSVKYDDAAVAANAALAQFEIAVSQASGTVATNPTDSAANAAADELRAFRKDAHAAVSVNEMYDPATDIMRAAYDWWAKENQRRRAVFIDRARSLRMPMWPELSPGSGES